MSLWYHPHITPEYVLRTPWDELLSDDARALAERAMAQGHRYVRVAGCDAFDPHQGCLGHLEPAPGPDLYTQEYSPA
jgi:hypothetical protein